MAGWSSYNKLDVFVLIPMQSVALALTTFVGQNYGAGRMDRARQGVWQALWMTLSVTAVLCVAIVLGARPLNRLFTADEEVISYGVRFISIISPFYLACCFNPDLCRRAARARGDAKTPMYIMLFSFVLFRQAYLFINRQLGNSFSGRHPGLSDGLDRLQRADGAVLPAFRGQGSKLPVQLIDVPVLAVGCKHHGALSRIIGGNLAGIPAARALCPHGCNRW